MACICLQVMGGRRANTTQPWFRATFKRGVIRWAYGPGPL